MCKNGLQQGIHQGHCGGWPERLLTSNRVSTSPLPMIGTSAAPATSDMSPQSAALLYLFAHHVFCFC